MNIAILPNGDLKLTADNLTRACIADMQNSGRDYWSIMAELFEPYFMNGSYQPFDAGDANPFVGLTSAPCIAESMDVHDDGTREIVGRLWWFPDYQGRDDLEELKTHGHVVYTLVEEA